MKLTLNSPYTVQIEAESVPDRMYLYSFLKTWKWDAKPIQVKFGNSPGYKSNWQGMGIHNFYDEIVGIRFQAGMPEELLRDQEAAIALHRKRNHEQDHLPEK